MAEDSRPFRRSARARARLALLDLAHRAYETAMRTPLRGVLRLPAVRGLLRRWKDPMEVRDVLEILDTLAGAGVRSWLAGGWGVDALAGRRTRDHKDLDLVVDRADAPAAGAALRARGFVLLPGTVPGAERSVPDALMPDREVFRDAAGRTVDVHPVDVGEWPAGIRPAFAAGQVGGRAVDCISPAAQAAAHRGYEVQAAHAGDLALIERLLAPASDPA